MASIPLLDELKSSGYEASLITTYNAYMPFYEEVVLRKLGSNGVRHNVLMMDMAQCQQSFADHPPRFAGRQYTLLPMHSSGAFHPKVILLVGKKKGLLAIGSHNLTLSGFGYNLELTNLIRYRSGQKDGSVAVIRQALHYILGWVARQGERLPAHLVKMVDTVSAFAPWLDEDDGAPEDVSVIASSADGADLLSLLKEKIHDPVSRIIAGGAFFDAQLTFVKRLKQDLNPVELIVAIDPQSVKVPAILSEIEAVRVVDVSNLPFQNSKDGASQKYLHAKYLVIETTSGRRLLATGSANPSAPAWLTSEDKGNTEMMLVRSDSKVNDTLQELGLSAIPDAPQVNEEAWAILREHWEQEQPELTPSIPLGIAVAAGERIQVNAPIVISAPFYCDLLDSAGNPLERIAFKKDLNGFDLEPKPEHFSTISFIRVYSVSEGELQFFVHHEAQLTEQSRTGMQRKFNDALASLSFSSPDLETFLNCVERIIFTAAKDDEPSKITTKDHSLRVKVGKDEIAEGFAVDVSDTRKIKKKHRLQVKEDLAYLLDVLIYHLKVDDAAINTHDSLDQRGRSEEEQVGAEDADDTGQTSTDARPVDRAKILHICHSKVKKLVNRAIDNLVQFREVDLDVEDLLVKLVAVLAVLRELRNCDGTQSWVEKGKTTVPLDLRKKLLHALLANLFEGKKSLQIIKRDFPALADSEDVARLKGLIIWLTWDCDLKYCAVAPFAESPDEEEERFLGNAALLAVAQLADESGVLEQAKESIGALCSGDLAWLDWVSNLGDSLRRCRIDDAPPPSDATSPGDFAIHPGFPHLGYRLIRQYPYQGSLVAMVRFDEDNPLLIYKAGMIRTLSATQFAVRSS